MELKIISPKGVVCNATVERVSLPGEAGRFTVLKDHAPIISTLSAGIIEFNDKDSLHTLPVKGGFVRVSNNKIEISVETNGEIQ